MIAYIFCGIFVWADWICLLLRGKWRVYFHSCHGSWAHYPILALLCVCVCAGVCVWVCLIEADSLQLRIIYRGYIRSCHAVLCCQILRLSAVPASVITDLCRFLDSITGHLAAHCFPALPAPTYGELNLVSSVSPV